MEPEIRHVRFFNGQFLRENEFNEEQLYANHMRRRVNYALFTDGVVEITPADLRIVRVDPANVADKRVRISSGMAVGGNATVFEGREIILRADSAITDLDTNFNAGDTVFVTVNYRAVESTPVPLGSTTENSRIEENAQIQFHGANPTGQLTVDGDPLIVLGSVVFNNMNVGYGQRQIARLRSTLLAPAPSLSISPPSVTAGGPVTLTLTAGGGLSLSTLTTGNISFSNSADITGLAVVGVPTPTTAQISFNLGAAAVAGARTVFVNIPPNGSASFTVNAFVPLPTINLGTFPGSTAANAILIIDGTNFVPLISVAFSGGGVVKTTFTGSGELVTPTQIRLRVPPSWGGSTGTLTITTGGGSVTSPPINI